MVDLLLIYPYFNDDHSIFKFPPLGIGYIASYVRNHGYSAAIVDCTFMREEEAIAKAISLKPRVVGIYSMLSMKETTIRLAKELKKHCELIIVGGPLPTTSPDIFLNDFDVVVIGEGEESVLEIIKTFYNRNDLSKVKGIAYKEKDNGLPIITPCRPPIKDLDALPFPARDLYQHEAYKEYFQRHHGYTITSMIASRGCPFQCDFCSRPVFGRSYRSRSAANITDEIASVISYGYDRIWFSDDIFPINEKFGVSVCDEIMRRGLDVSWECLCRADVMTPKIALKMKKAGCYRVFFGLESGNNEILKIMKKRLTVEQAKRAVEIVKSAGIKVGAFFIIGYPGETNDTMRDTINFASSLSLDYLSFTVPYPIPGTGLYEKLEQRIMVDEWKKPKYDPVKHVLLYKSEFSMSKLKFGMMKAEVQSKLRKHLGYAYPLVGGPFEYVTEKIFTAMK